MKQSLFIGIILCLVFVISASAQEGVPDSVAKYLALGDRLSDAWDHQGAADAYLTVISYDPEHYEALWKAGDQYTEIADRIEMKHQKESYFTQARKLCEKAVEVHPDGWEGHFRLSVALGRLALFRGGKEKIRLSQMVKEEADKAVALNPNADLAYHVLGRWHQNIANLSGMLKFFAKVLYGGVPDASNEESADMFKKAIAIDPDHIEHHLELARTYQFMDEKDLARQSLEQVLSLPAVDEDDSKFKKEAEKMLKKLK